MAPRTMAKLAIIPALGLLAAVSVLLVVVFAVDTFHDPCPRDRDSRFNAIRTTADAEQEFLGKTRDEIVEQYGQTGAARFGTDYDATYFMRPQGFCMDGWYLAINFDNDGFAVHAAVIPG